MKVEQNCFYINHVSLMGNSKEKRVFGISRLSTYNFYCLTHVRNTRLLKFTS